LVRWNGRAIVISLLSAEQEHALDLQDHPDAGAGSEAVDDVSRIGVTDPAMASVEPPVETLPKMPPEETREEFSGLWGDAKRLWVVGGAAHVQQAQADDDTTEVAVVRRFDGRRWTSTVVGKSPGLVSVWGRSGDDIWAAAQDLRSLSHFSEDRGKRTYALHWDGRRWQRAPAVPFDWVAGGAAHLTALLQFDNGRISGPFWKGTSASLWELRTARDVGGGDEGTVVQFSARRGLDAGAELPEKVFKDASYGLQDIFGTEDGQVWVAGRRGALHHFDGQHWSGIDPSTDEQLYELKGVASVGDEIWAVGVHGILRRQGGRWTAVSSGTDVDLFAAWGSSPDDVWVVGNLGVILHCRRDGCKEVRPPRRSPPRQPLWTVAGLGPNDIWAEGGEPGVGLHWDGKAWTEAALPSKRPLRKMVAAHGELWLGRHRWDGTSWSTEAFSALPANEEIIRVDPVGPDNRWVWTSHGVFHLVAGAVVDSAKTAQPYALGCALGTNEMVLFGSLGQLHGKDGKWKYHLDIQPPLPPGFTSPYQDVTDCVAAKGSMWVVGKDGRVLQFKGTRSHLDEQ
jgi:hypothetical protein